MCDGAQMAIFGDFFLGPVFGELHAAGFRRVEVWQTSNLRRLRLGEEKSRKKKLQTTG